MNHLMIHGNRHGRVGEDRSISSLRQPGTRQITDRLGRAAGNGHRLLEQLYEKPIVSVNDVRAISRTTFPSANQIVQRLVDLGILKEITGHARHRRFQYEPYVALFRN